MDTLSVTMQTIDEKVMFSAGARGNPAIVIDYFPPIGTGKGYTSMELLMISLGSCVSTTLITLLRNRMKKTIAGIVTEVNGTICDEHPKKLNQITILLKINAQNLTNAELQEALNIVETKVCPVWAMLKGNVTVNVKSEIVLLMLNLPFFRQANKVC